MHCRLFFRGRGDSLLNIYPAGCANTTNIHIPIPRYRPSRTSYTTASPTTPPTPSYPSNHPFASSLTIPRLTTPSLFLPSQKSSLFPGRTLYTCVIYAHLRTSTCVYVTIPILIFLSWLSVTRLYTYIYIYIGKKEGTGNTIASSYNGSRYRSRSR